MWALRLSMGVIGSAEVMGGGMSEWVGSDGCGSEWVGSDGYGSDVVGFGCFGDGEVTSGSGSGCGGF